MSEATQARTTRKVRVGVVKSSKMEKTVVVALERRFAHPLYHKQVTVTKSVKAHDELGAGEGDTVKIMETRPLSKTKRWRVVEIVTRAL